MTLSLRNPILIAVLATIALVLLGSTFAIVPETSQAVVLRLGKPEAIYNPYRANEDFGHTGAGLKIRLPFFDQIVWIDKRIQSVAMERQQVLSTDQLRLQVDAFARYRIVDPRQMYIAAGSEERVADALKPILGSALRNELGKRQARLLLSPERGEVMTNIRKSLNVVARQYGAQIVDVRITRTDLPDGAPLQNTLQRMRSAREQEAATIRAEGARRAQEIRGQADADAAKVYAASFGKDPAFYDFYRAMQSYRVSLKPDAAAGETTAILSPDSEYLRQFRGR
ncbi:protease modulator HflC [Sphingobium nicotianae]|uniref:Protein HflC n=1 Tax=Sphingobium nicotianae TaxID=2782607 RepID=A0A9X1ISR7_9SPHN|nr:protease modulator HflC [Sphingobium nicotianae]MBT2188549.1 protease modulator HflC [Sphingobium nicotianae]